MISRCLLPEMAVSPADETVYADCAEVEARAHESTYDYEVLAFLATHTEPMLDEATRSVHLGLNSCLYLAAQLRLEELTAGSTTSGTGRAAGWEHREYFEVY